MKRVVLSVLLAGYSLFSLNTQAAVTITFVESGSDVVATSSGSLITTGLPNPSQLNTTLGYVAGTGFVGSWSCVLLVGTDPSEADTFTFTNWNNNNVDVCSTGGRFNATSGTGNFVGVISRNGSTDGIYIPNNYVSGSAIAGTSTWAGQSFASLGLVPGTYVYTFGTSPNDDSITVVIGGAAPANQSPVASFTFNCTDLDCSFDASASSDPDGTVVQWDWDFGDGMMDSGEMVNHSYAAAGSYVVTLTVTDDDGATNATTQTVNPTIVPPPPPPPPPQPAVPVPGPGGFALAVLALLLGLGGAIVIRRS